MDHVIGSGDDADLLVDGNHHRVVHFEQVAGRRLTHIAAVGHGGTVAAVECGDEGQTLAFARDVVVAPLPLVTGGLDSQVGIGGVFFWATSTFVAGRAMRITMMNGTTVQTTSTVTDSWKLADLRLLDLRCFRSNRTSRQTPR